MIKKILSLSVMLLSLYTEECYTQLTYRYEIGIGKSPYYRHEISKVLNVAVGYSFFEELNAYGGINLFNQSSYVFKSELGNELEQYNVAGKESFTSFLLQGGLHYSISIIKIDTKQSSQVKKRIGIFPELNAYFNPHVKRKYEDREGNKYKAPRSTQLAFGVGGGLFYGSWRRYLAIKYECNTIGTLDSIAKVADDVNKESKYNHIVSLLFTLR